jgi:hypothetical protein
VDEPEAFFREMETSMRHPDYFFDSSHSTWVIGKIMWEMMTLRDSQALNDEINHLTEEAYWGRMQEEAVDEIQTTRIPEYSETLRALVRRCLRLSPTLRPAPADLHEETQRELRNQAQDVGVEMDGSTLGSRVYYMGNKINDMPVGCNGLYDQSIRLREEEYLHGLQYRCMDPELEPLRKGRWEPQPPTS